MRLERRKTFNSAMQQPLTPWRSNDRPFAQKWLENRFTHISRNEQHKDALEFFISVLWQQHFIFNMDKPMCTVYLFTIFRQNIFVLEHQLPNSSEVTGFDLELGLLPVWSLSVYTGFLLNTCRWIGYGTYCYGCVCVNACCSVIHWCPILSIWAE